MVKYASSWHANTRKHRKQLGHLCYVCGSDYKKKGLRIDRNHVRYDNMEKEKAYQDIVLLCNRHHLKGSKDLQLDNLKRWRSSYRIEKVTILLTLLPFRLLWSLAKRVYRLSMPREA